MNPRLLSLLFAAGLASSAFALDLGGLSKALGNADKLKKGLDTANDASKVMKGLAGIGPEEERLIGDSVSLEIVGKYGGLVRDEATMRRVNLVGRALARYSDRPGLEWRFGVLDSDTVNAFSAPDGYVFITRGLYALAETDDILAAILGNAQLLKMQLAPGHEGHGRVSQILIASNRAKDLVQQILMFSRQREQERRVTNLGAIVAEAARCAIGRAVGRATNTQCCSSTNLARLATALTAPISASAIPARAASTLGGWRDVESA